jgi:hypothetical protein
MEICFVILLLTGQVIGNIILGRYCCLDPGIDMPTKKDDLTRIVGKYIRDVAPDALEAYLEQTGLTEG